MSDPKAGPIRMIVYPVGSDAAATCPYRECGYVARHKKVSGVERDMKSHLSKKHDRTGAINVGYADPPGGM